MRISVKNVRTMTLTPNIILFLFFCVTNIWTHSQAELESNDLNEGNYGVKLFNNDVYLSLLKDNPPDDKVFITLYYEVHCPHCINFYLNQFAPIVETMMPYSYMVTIPFGNGKIIYDEDKLEIKCQHGPAECYGNKLHACALKHLPRTTALLYNACLMNSTDGLGSDDKSADRCGKLMNIDSEVIRKCGKGRQGLELLIIMGELSKRANFSHVPYVLINDKVYDVNSNNFKEHVCAAFTNPPPPCQNGTASL